ncbi:MAG: type IV pilus assembly protein PilM [Planctomycetota bacterium]
MPSGNAVWGIDVGQCALKALKLRPAGDGKVEAVAFDVIEHPKILSQPDADRDELIKSALEKFASRNEWQGDAFVVGVPGQQTFARFCKMPPIDLKKDAKKIHDLVRYEASQQIPFDIEDVVWDYQIFTSDGSPDLEVGIFAIRKDLIRKHLAYFSGVNIAPTLVQTIPAALYNFCQFDGQTVGAGGATVLIDVGAQNTDLIIVEENSAWTRNIPLGGNSFTEALVRSFKLSFAKAESLKRSAGDHKYARQIFQAMRPVFADLVAEIQRSIGFYTTSHRDIELRKVIALGNAFRLPGLQKYLENNLTMKVEKLERLGNLVPSATVNAPQFTDNILSFAAAYGLAVQGLGLGKIRASLLPTELARVVVWQRKRPYFIATAASLLIAGTLPWIANALDRQALGSQGSSAVVTDVINQAQKFKKAFGDAQTDTGKLQTEIEYLQKMQEKKLLVPLLLALVDEAMPPSPQPELAQAATVEEFKKLIEASPAKFDRTKRNQLIIDSLRLEYVPDVMTASIQPGGARSTASTGGPAGMVAPMGGRGGPPMMGGRMAVMRQMMQQQQQQQQPEGEPAGANAGFVVRLQGRLLCGTEQYDASAWLTEYQQKLRELAGRKGLGFHIPPDDPTSQDRKAFGNAIITKAFQGGGQSYLPSGLPATPNEKNVQAPDPVTEEETVNDWQVEFAFRVKLGDPPAAAEGAAGQPGAAGGAPPTPGGPGGPGAPPVPGAPAGPGGPPTYPPGAPNPNQPPVPGGRSD